MTDNTIFVCKHMSGAGYCNLRKEFCCEVGCLDRAPIEYAQVKHGRWVLGKVEPGYFTPGGNRPWVCSECGQLVSWMLDKPKENYCPECGARMDGE